MSLRLRQCLVYGGCLGCLLLARWASGEPKSAVPKQATARGDERYFMLVFAHERDSLSPRLSHTYAAFVKTDGRSARKRPEMHVISWLPATLDVRLLRRQPETGVNLDLRSSLSLGMSLNVRISMWGPYRIKKELFDRAVRQEARLKKRAIKYKAMDTGFRPHAASNCFHAIADIDCERGMLDTGNAHGEPATAMVVEHLRRWIINPGETHDWLMDRLGLASYPIIRRDQAEIATQRRGAQQRELAGAGK